MQLYNEQVGDSEWLNDSNIPNLSDTMRYKTQSLILRLSLVASDWNNITAYWKAEIGPNNR